jgi:hypothetical protein
MDQVKINIYNPISMKNMKITIDMQRISFRLVEVSMGLRVGPTTDVLRNHLLDCLSSFIYIYIYGRD